MNRLIVGLIFCAVFARADEVEDNLRKILAPICADYGCTATAKQNLEYMRAHHDRAVEVLTSIVKGGDLNSLYALGWLGELGPYSKGETRELLISKAAEGDEAIRNQAYRSLTVLSEKGDKIAHDFIIERLNQALDTVEAIRAAKAKDAEFLRLLRYIHLNSDTTGK